MPTSPGFSPRSFRISVSLILALGLLATLKSFRGSPTESLIRRGAESAIVRAEGIRDEREVLIELEVGRRRTRAQVNRQRLQRSRDLLGALRMTVFAPDDLALIKEGPAIRRDYLDDALVALDPKADAMLRELERILKQRNALLRQAHGRLDEGIVEKHEYSERPVRREYRFTEKGRALWPVLSAMWRFGEDWMFDDAPTVELVDADTGALVRPVVVDAESGRAMDSFRSRVRFSRPTPVD